MTFIRNNVSLRAFVFPGYDAEVVRTGDAPPMPWRDLHPSVQRLITLLAFFDSEDIPLDLLVPVEAIPAEYSFLKENLKKWLKRVLLKRPKVHASTSPPLSERIWAEAWLDTASMSYSTLVSDYRHEPSHEDRELACLVAAMLLYDKFPRRHTAEQMEDYFGTCGSLICHVECFAQRYKELQHQGFSQKIGNLSFLLSDAALYLQDIGFPSRALRLIRLAVQESTESTVQSPSTSIFLLGTCGTIEDQLAHYEDAVRSFSAVLKQEEALDPPSLATLAFAHSMLAYALPGIWRAEDAIVAANRSIAIFEFETADACVDEGTQLAYQPDRLHRNRARAYFFAGDFDTAKKGFEVADEWATRIHGEKSHYHGEVLYSLARIAMAQQEYGKASRLFCEARFWLRPDSIPPFKYTGARAAATLQLGRVLTLQGKTAEALEEFDHALSLTRDNVERGEGLGERARIQWWRADVLEKLRAEALEEFREGEEVEAFKDEAEAMREEAMKSREELYSTGKFVRPSDEDGETMWDGLVGVMYR
ncbi:hypothetical protein K490DRAFT_62503 [Saccharata proteae CBS 121410]|uniref:TPR-like protein n=1 Tax=Saccharata proteae CBS 121410 TaxID=1314787 RepID=A0A9P4LY28_9PEZI|nr:hypothetical protein K490DRAFT_62503 [Saccharata proteae CBS 121410]